MLIATASCVMQWGIATLVRPFNLFVGGMV